MSEEPTCRYCYDTASPSLELFSPCECRGTQKYIHRECLNKWLQESKTEDKCEICQFIFVREPSSNSNMKYYFFLVFQLVYNIYGFIYMYIVFEDDEMLILASIPQLANLGYDLLNLKLISYEYNIKVHTYLSFLIFLNISIPIYFTITLLFRAISEKIFDIIYVSRILFSILGFVIYLNMPATHSKIGFQGRIKNYQSNTSTEISTINIV